MERNVISKNTTIIGDIKAAGDFRIDGVLEGSLKTKGRVILGADGTIKGNVEASNADIEGIFSGQLKVEKTLTVKTIATIFQLHEDTVGKYVWLYSEAIAALKEIKVNDFSFCKTLI